MQTIKKLCVILLFLVLAEIIARVWLVYIASPRQYLQYALCSDIPRQKFKYTPHHYLNYYPTPSYKEGKLSHNSLGFRGREISIKKPEGVYRIAILGGSTVYDVMIEDNDKIFTAQLEYILNNKYGYKVEVINAGAAGYDSFESLINFEFRILDLAPDLVIDYDNCNDVHSRLVEPSSYRGDNSGRRKQWKAPPVLFFEHCCILRVFTRKIGFLFNIEKLKRQVGLETFVSPPTVYDWTKYSQEKMLAVLESNPPVYFQRNLKNIAAIAKEHNIDVILATWAYSPEFPKSYSSTMLYQQGFKENNEVIKKVASHCGVMLFDFSSVMPKNPEYWFDGRHNTEKGSEKQAELFAEFIRDKGFIENRRALQSTY